ncbi:hypothetical protein GCM10010353_37580 [Streptomyces chryseus]|nr:hypothetical protein GCM10010353_37580 [Streptomyces chryseus]
MYAIQRPSGDQDTSVTGSGSESRRWASAPSAVDAHNCGTPPRSQMNATCSPVGSAEGYQQPCATSGAGASRRPGASGSATVAGAVDVKGVGSDTGGAGGAPGPYVPGVPGGSFGSRGDSAGAAGAVRCRCPCRASIS